MHKSQAKRLRNAGVSEGIIQGIETSRKIRQDFRDKKEKEKENKTVNESDTLTIEENDKLYLYKANGDVAYEVTDHMLPDPLHELNRYAKETGKNTGSMNKPKGSPVKKGGSTDKALNFVRSKIRKETGRPAGQQKKVKGKKNPNERNDKLQRKISAVKDKRAFADRAKKAGFKSSQDYANTVARYGGEKNYKNPNKHGGLGS